MVTSRTTPIAIGVIAALHALSVGGWLIVADPTAAHDDANLLLWAADLERWLAAGAPGGLPLHTRGAPYPPLVSLSAALAFTATGSRSVGLACAAAAPWVGLLSLCWGLSLARLRGPWAGLAAAAIAPLPLWSLGHPGSLHAEIPLASLVGSAAAVGGMVLARPRLRGGVAVGVLAALSLWTKWTALVFLLPLAGVGLWGRARGATALALATTAALTAPWYLPELPRIVAFASENLRGAYAGEAAPLALAATFYPSRLVTGVLGTPLLLCALGGLTARRRGVHRVAALCLVLGIAFLTLQPYRDQRYLIAGVGLLCPLLVEGALRFGGRVGAGLLLAVGLGWAGSWLPPAGAQGSSAIASRDGLRRQGLRAARADLGTPRWRVTPAAPDPIGPVEPLRQAARAIRRHAPEAPLSVHLVDLVGRSALERARVELTVTHGAGVQISRSPLRDPEVRRRLEAGRAEAWTPPARLADRAWIIESLPPDALDAARPAWAQLQAEGRRVVFRGGRTDGARPAVVQVWAPPGR